MDLFNNLFWHISFLLPSTAEFRGGIVPDPGIVSDEYPTLLMTKDFGWAWGVS